MTIKLLRLPDLVRINILEYMGFIDLFMIAISSERMKRIVKRDVKVRNYEICFRFKKAIYIAFFNMNDWSEQTKFAIQPIKKFRKSLPIIKHGDDYIQVIFKNSTLLITFWFEQLDGAKSLFKTAKEVFKAPPFGNAHIDLDDIKLDYQDIVRWMNELKKPLVEINFTGENQDSSVFTWIVEHTTASNKLKIASKTLTNDTIKECLQKLKDGSNPQLKQLYLDIYRVVDEPPLLNGFEIEEEEEGWSFRLDNGDKCKVFSVEFNGNGEIIDSIEILIERK